MIEAHMCQTRRLSLRRPWHSSKRPGEISVLGHLHSYSRRDRVRVYLEFAYFAETENFLLEIKIKVNKS